MSDEAPDDEPPLVRRALLVQARYINTAANIASGHGEYGLANRLWQFESRLRKKARGKTVEREPD